MIIIQMKGGLGNQLFYYGLYRKLAALGKEVKIDDVSGFAQDPQRDPCLAKLGITYCMAEKEEVTRIRDAYMDPFHRVRRKLFGRKTMDYYEPADGNFDPAVFALEEAYLNGFFQSWKYFPEEALQDAIKAQILEARDGYLKEESARALSEEIGRTSNAVSLHIRRGDYLVPGIKETYEGICTEEYYARAMERIRRAYPDAVFYIFSNDLAWCREQYKGIADIRFTETDGENADIAELFLMAGCRHHIMANSSFSWWGAFLGEKGGMTIAPSKWLNNKEMRDIYTDAMIRL